MHSTLAVQKQHSQSSQKAHHNFAPASRHISPGKARGEEQPDNNEAISVLSDIFPVSHSEFALVGGVDGAGKRALEVKQSSLVMVKQKDDGDSRRSRRDRSFNNSTMQEKSHSIVSTIDFSAMPVKDVNFYSHPPLKQADEHPEE